MFPDLRTNAFKSLVFVGLAGTHTNVFPPLENNRKFLSIFVNTSSMVTCQSSRRKEVERWLSQLQSDEAQFPSVLCTNDNGTLEDCSSMLKAVREATSGPICFTSSRCGLTDMIRLEQQSKQTNHRGDHAVPMILHSTEAFVSYSSTCQGAELSTLWARDRPWVIFLISTGCVTKMRTQRCIHS